AWAGFWLDGIGTLYRLAEDPEHRVANRREILDHLALLRVRAEQERDDLTLPAECRKPAISLLAHWDGLTVFLDHPEVPLDNNASERGLRGPVVGRKNFWGFGKKWSAELSVCLYTLFATWSLHGLNLRTALSDYLSVCAQRGKSPEDLRPW
ncbi:transposase IS66, partial [mine drainage metagenome]